MKALSSAVGLVLVLALAMGLQAAEKASAGKEKTLKGTLTCAKCDLGETKECHTVLVVKEEGKDTVYYLDKKGKYEHKAICTSPKQASVTGTVSEKGGKHTITASKIEIE